jgi:hypothetical protein
VGVDVGVSRSAGVVPMKMSQSVCRESNCVENGGDIGRDVSCLLVAPMDGCIPNIPHGKVFAPDGRDDIEVI